MASAPFKACPSQTHLRRIEIAQQDVGLSFFFGLKSAFIEKRPQSSSSLLAS